MDAGGDAVCDPQGTAGLQQQFWLKSDLQLLDFYRQYFMCRCPHILAPRCLAFDSSDGEMPVGMLAGGFPLPPQGSPSSGDKAGG